MRKRLAAALARPSQISEMETFCDLQVTSESAEALARAWSRPYWIGNAVTAWSYKMVDYATDDEVRRARPGRCRTDWTAARAWRAA